ILSSCFSINETTDPIRLSTIEVNVSRMLFHISVIDSLNSSFVFHRYIKPAVNAATAPTINVTGLNNAPKTGNNAVSDDNNEPAAQTIGPIAANEATAINIHCFILSSNSVNPLAKLVIVSTAVLIGPSPN